MDSIKSIVNKVNQNMKSNRTFIVCSTMALTFGTAVVTHAEDPVTPTYTADSSITSAFTTIASNGVATIKGVAVIGIGILTIFLLWKYGKKIFNKVAN